MTDREISTKRLRSSATTWSTVTPDFALYRGDTTSTRAAMKRSTSVELPPPIPHKSSLRNIYPALRPSQNIANEPTSWYHDENDDDEYHPRQELIEELVRSLDSEGPPVHIDIPDKPLRQRYREGSSPNSSISSRTSTDSDFSRSNSSAPTSPSSSISSDGTSDYFGRSKQGHKAVHFSDPIEVPDKPFGTISVIPQQLPETLTYSPIQVVTLNTTTNLKASPDTAARPTGNEIPSSMGGVATYHWQITTPPASKRSTSGRYSTRRLLSLG